MQNNQLPSVEAIKTAIQQESGLYQHYFSCGGKIEHVLNALIHRTMELVSKNVLVTCPYLTVLFDSNRDLVVRISIVNSLAPLMNFQHVVMMKNIVCYGYDGVVETSKIFLTGSSFPNRGNYC